MSDVNGAAPAAGSGKDQVSEAPDDGLNDEERAQFADMQRETAAPAPVDTPVVNEPAPAAGAGDPAPGGDDDDDEADPAAGAAGEPGASGERKPRRVSFSKYERETRELKDKLAKADGTVAEMRAMQARLDERMKIINEALSTPPAAADDGKNKAPPLPKAEDDPEPDMEADIFAWNQWNRREQLRLREEVRQSQQQSQQERQAEVAERETNQTYMHDAETFAGTEPNFVPAYQFLMASRVAELAVHYFGKDLSAEGQKLTREEYAKISNTIVGEEKTIVQSALKAGRSPSAQLFAIAKSRGFKPAAAAAGEKPAVNGAAGAQKPTASAKPPGALDEPAAPSVIDEIMRVKNGQDAALSLSGGGGAPPAALDAVKLANMPQDEFEAMVEQMTPGQLKKLMGG